MAAPVLVQSTGKVRKTPGDGSPVNLTFGSPVVAGNMIRVSLAMWKNNNNPEILTCTDGQGNTYINAVTSAANNNSRAAIWYAYNILASGALTVSLGVLGQYTTAVATEWSGYGASDPLDVGATATGASSAPAVGPTGVSAENDAQVAAVVGVSAGLASIAVQVVVPGWTEEFEELSFSFEPGEADSRVVTTTGTQSCAWTLNTSASWAAAIAVFSAEPPRPPERVTQMGRRTVLAGASARRVTQMARRVIYPQTCAVVPPGPPPPAFATYQIRRQRRALLPSSPRQFQVSIPTLELLMRTGIGNLAEPGKNPQVMMRISKDGGQTWTPERWESAGLRGRWSDRVRWTRATGHYRNAVVEITVSDPNQFELLALLGTPVEGPS